MPLSVQGLHRSSSKSATVAYLLHLYPTSRGGICRFGKESKRAYLVVIIFKKGTTQSDLGQVSWLHLFNRSR